MSSNSLQQRALGDVPFRASIADRSLPRREFLAVSLLAVGSVALGRIPAGLGEAGAGLAGFVRLSRIATGVNVLPAGLAQQYLSALDAASGLKVKPSEFVRLAGYATGAGPPSLAELERSPAYARVGGKECVEAVAAAWWSGIVPTPGGGQRVITFANALVWRQVHEPMTCQGAVGSWSEPGRAVA